MSSTVVSRQYQKFIKLLEKWPKDPTKSKRDLGEHLRKQVKDLSSNPNSITSCKSSQFDRQLDSLERLASNYYGSKYKRLYSSTATGLTADECRQVLSSENLQSFNEERSFF